MSIESSCPVIPNRKKILYTNVLSDLTSFQCLCMTLQLRMQTVQFSSAEMKLIRYFLLFCLFLYVCARGGRGRTRGRGGGFDGVDESLLDPWSFLPDRNMFKASDRKREINGRFRSIKTRRSETNYGTKFNNKESISQKAFGLGVGPSFIGGAGLGLLEPNYGFVAGLVSFNVYHRYVFFKKLLHQMGNHSQWNSQYYETYYEK